MTEETTTDRPGPSVAVVLPASGNHTRLTAALRQLVPACREFRVEVCIVWPESAGPVSPAEGRDGRLTFLASPSSASIQEQRSLAVRELDADILVFTDEDQALVEDWNETLMLRSGLFTRRSGEVLVDWLDRLDEPEINGPEQAARGG